MSRVGAAVQLQRVRVGDLPELARRALQDPARYTIVPITIQRAEAQARNPAASPDDAGLIVAYLEDRCIGYLGMFPAWLEEPSGRRKVLSLSAFYVGPEYRGTGAGALLLLQALSLGQDLFVAGFSEVAGRIYQGVGFRPVGPLGYLVLRLDAALVLPLLLGRLRHGAGLRGPGWISRALDGARRMSRLSVEAALRPLLIRLLLGPLRASSNGLQFRAVESVRRPERLADARPSQGRPKFVRDDAMVNWMIHHPWITEDPSVRVEYAFSYRRDLFRFLPFHLSAVGGGPDLGYVVLRVSSEAERTVLTILDCALVDDRHRQVVLALAFREALRWSADRIECGDEFWPVLRSSLLHRVLTRREQRGCLVVGRGGASGNRLRDLEPGFCDGDAPFV